MAEYKLSYTASEIDERLSMVDNMVKSVNGQMPDENGNVEIPTNGSASKVVIDTTLSQEGQAADAKAVGDAIGSLPIFGEEGIRTIVEEYMEENSQTMATLTINGQKFDGSQDMNITIEEPEAQTIEKLTFTGAVDAEYDGSKAVTVNIPNGSSDYTLPVATSETLGGVKPVAKTEGMTQEVGVDSEGKLYTSPSVDSGESSSGGSSDWEVIGEVTSDGTGDSVGIYIPIDFTQYKKVFIRAMTTADGAITYRLVLSSTLAWYNGHIIISNARNEVELFQVEINNIMGSLYGLAYGTSGYSGGDITPKPFVSPRNDSIVDAVYQYIRLDTNNNGAVPEGCTLVVFGCK